MKNIKTNFRLTPWLTATVLSLVLAACGGEGQSPILGGGDIDPVVVTPPTVTVVTPVAGALDVAPNTKTITAAFSKAMDSATLTDASFTLACPLAAPISGGTVSYLADSKLATLTLSGALPSATVCTATVKNTVKDSTGVNMVNDYVWQFTTGATTDTTAPTVTLVSPVDAATDVATNTVVKATFSEAMDPLTLTTANFTLTSIGGPVAGTISINPLNTVATFKPNAILAVDTLYTATVSTSVTDQAGNPLAVNKVWTFTTAATATVEPLVMLNMAQPFGTFGGSAGMTNMGILTVVNGDIGTTCHGDVPSITGFLLMRQTSTPKPRPTLGNVNRQDLHLHQLDDGDQFSRSERP